jgi:xanthine/CO dehydrogenase XdhC/CoxF family maturation factor
VTFTIFALRIGCNASVPSLCFSELRRKLPHMSEELRAASAWLADGHAVALGTVIQTWGSAPRPAGSQIAVRDDGAFLGSVSGGCVEGQVIEAARSAIADGKSRELEFGVTDAEAWEVGLACGGRIRILVEPIET